MQNIFSIPTPHTFLQWFQLLAIVGLAIYTIWILYNVYTGKWKNSPKQKHFRLEITAYANGGIQIGLATDKQLSGDGISEILMSALPVIGKKDPHVLKLLFYHSLEALEGDADIQKALTNFYEEVGELCSPKCSKEYEGELCSQKHSQECVGKIVPEPPDDT